MSNPADDEARHLWLAERPDRDPFVDDMEDAPWLDEAYETAYAEWRRQDLEEQQVLEDYRELLQERRILRPENE